MAKTADSAQIVLDNRGKKGSQAASSTGMSCSSVLRLVLKLVAMLLVVSNIAALYMLHFVSQPLPTPGFIISSFSVKTGTNTSVSDAVSLSSDSKLRNGAGTTVYLDRSALRDTDVMYYEFINMAKLCTSASTYTTNLMSYRRVKASAKESVLTTFAVNPSTKAVSISSSFDATRNIVSSDAIRGIATLSDTQALVLVVDDATSVYKTYLMRASITSSGAAVDQTKRKLIASDSQHSYITRINSKSTIVTYTNTENTPASQSVKVATVADDGAISLSTPTEFSTLAGRYWTYPIAINSTEGTFVIPFYMTDPFSDSFGLCITMSAIFNHEQHCEIIHDSWFKFRPRYFVSGVMLTNNILLVGFYDSENYDTLTLVIYPITSDLSSTLRSYYVFPEVAGPFAFGTKNGFDPELSFTPLSLNRVAVSFFNPTMNGGPCIKVLKYSTDTLTFKTDVTPILPVAPSTFTLDIGDNTVDVPVSQQILAIDDDSVIAMHMGMRGVAHQHVSLVELFGSPMGLLRHYNGKANADVAVSGKATDVSTKDNAKMAVGQFYYATTAGYVVTPASTTQSGAEYFTASEDAKVLVTADSKVGVAIATDELFVSTAL